MDSLQDILAGKQYDEPDEIAAIKRFIRDEYQSDAGVTLRERDIVVQVPSAALATRLRYDMQRLQQAAGSDKRIVLRIGR